MIKGKNAENEKLAFTPKCRKRFGELGQTVENLVYNTKGSF
jgi:hypothetical protein